MTDILTTPDSDLFNEYVHNSQVAGLPITVRFRINTEPNPPTVLPGLEAFFDRVSAAWDGDEGGPLDALRRGQLDVVDAPPLMVSMLRQTAQIREMTGGLVDPWRSPEGFLFRGWFRGWVAQQVKNRSTPAGYWDMHVTFGNVDLFHGQRGHAVPWVVPVPVPGGGRRDTFNYLPSAGEGALAVVGENADILHPGTLQPAPDGREVVVFGSDAGMVDAFAAAIAVGGVDAADWLMSRHDGYSVLMADGDERYGYGELADVFSPAPATI